MAFIHFDSNYAPCRFLIVPDEGDPYDDASTLFIQTDWDYPGVASSMGLPPCHCGATDGTIDCEHKTASEMIATAYNFIVEHAGEPFDTLDEYLQP